MLLADTTIVSDLVRNPILQKIEILSLKPEVSAHYGDIRRSLEARGTPIGQNDLWIAAQARSLDAALVTDNVLCWELNAASRDRACAAIQRSFCPIGVPRASSDRRISP